jgi:hypothetical protein
MRILRANAQAFAFLLNTAEEHVLLQILGSYPVVPADHHTFSKTLADEAALEGERLLREALAEQRASAKDKLATWLEAPGRWRTLKQGRRLNIPREDVEWLLQVLNDVRVGSWIALGSPELHLNPELLAPEQQATWAMMELSGMFQMALLHAVERDRQP